MRARRKAWGWVAVALLSIGTLTAQISIPNTFTANTRIVSADVNENFAELGSKALNREGGAMSGDLAVENITFGAHNTYDIGTTGTRARDGWFGRNLAVTGTLTAGTFSGSGSGLTGLAETNIADGAIFPRLAANETITGDYTIGSVTPVLWFNETDAAANNRLWRIAAGGEGFFFQVYNDAVSSNTNFIEVQRTGTTVDSIALNATATVVSGSLAVGGGGAIASVLTGTASVSPDTISTGESQEYDVTVTGVQSGAPCFAGSTFTGTSEFTVSAYRSNSNTVSVRITNHGADTQWFVSATIRVTCFNY